MLTISKLKRKQIKDVYNLRTEEKEKYKNGYLFVPTGQTTVTTTKIYKFDRTYDIEYFEKPIYHYVKTIKNKSKIKSKKIEKKIVKHKKIKNNNKIHHKNDNNIRTVQFVCTLSEKKLTQKKKKKMPFSNHFTETTTVLLLSNKKKVKGLELVELLSNQNI